MATIDMATRLATKGGGRVKKESVTTPYMVEVTIDLAEAAETKGSALAASDVIQAVDVPKGTFIMASGVRLDKDLEGSFTAFNIELGVTSDSDRFVSSFVVDDLNVGFGRGSAGASSVVYNTDLTIDMTIAAQTGSVTGGKLTVWAVLADITNKSREPGLAAPGS